MPSRNVKTHMIVKTDKGLVLVDKDGNSRPLPAPSKSKIKVDIIKKKG